jgi:DNA-binding MarR family transcriptional regulator
MTPNTAAARPSATRAAWSQSQRSSFAATSPSGTDLAIKALLVGRCDAEALAGLSGEERDQLLRLLRRVIANLEKSTA